MTDGRDLPWLQQEADTDVWTNWSVTYRDVIIIDSDNRVTDIYNPTDQTLANGGNYAALKALMVNAANQ